MTLLARAREAGLAVSLDCAGELVVRGPKRLEALALDILAHNPAIVAALRAEDRAADHARAAAGGRPAASEPVNVGGVFPGARTVAGLPLGACPVCHPRSGSGQDAVFGNGLRCGRCGRSTWRPSGKGDGSIVCVVCHPPGRKDEPVPLEVLVAPSTCSTCGGPAWCLDGRWSCEQRDAQREAAPVIGTTVASPGSETQRQDLLTAAAARGFPRLQLRPGVWVAAGESSWLKLCENATAEDFAAAATAYGTPVAGDEAEPQAHGAAEASQR